MSTTPNMNLIVPEVLVTSGPQYATQINAALDVVDAHDHSSGKGVRVTPSGLNINTDLPFNSYQATGLKGVVLTDQNTATYLTNAAVFRSGKELYYRDSTGTLVQITLNGFLNTSFSGGISGLTAPASASYIPASKKFVWLSTGTEYASMETGDLKVISTVAGSAQAVTIKADSSTSAYNLNLPATGPSDNQIMRMKAATPGAFVSLLGTTNQVTVTHNSSDITLSLPQNIHTAATPTFAGLILTGTMTGTSLTLAGALSGVTTGAFSGQVNVGSLVSGGVVSGTTGTFSGNISLTGAASSTLSAANYDATFGSVTTDALQTNLILPKSGTFTAFSGELRAAAGFKTDTIAPYTTTTGGIAITGKTNGSAVSSPNIGYTTRYSPAGNVAFSASLSKFDDVLSFSLPAGEWELDANVIVEVYDAGGNAVTKVQFVQAAISTSTGAWDDDSYIGSLVFTESSYISSGNYLAVRCPSRTLRTSTSLTVYLVAKYTKATTNTNARYLAGSYIRIKRIG